MGSPMSTEYPCLPLSFKHRFPFRLSVPSFIYPADYLTNVRRLGPFVDEIELLLLESQFESLPSAQEIESLAALALEMSISYNVHLPIDLDMGGIHPEARRCAIDRMTTILELVRPLNPTTHTLHLDYSREDQRPVTIAQWQECACEALAALLNQTAIPAQRISVETLDYPPEWFAPMVNRLDLSVCLDAGHIVRYGFDLPSVLALFGPQITICHLHGVDQGRDHLGLDRLAIQPRETLTRFLRGFKGSASLEVFSFERLQASLGCIKEMMDAEGRGDDDRS